MEPVATFQDGGDSRKSVCRSFRHSLDLNNKEVAYHICYLLEFISEKEEAEKFKAVLKSIDDQSYLDLIKVTATIE
ncbi:hypothetical protein ABES58_19650 [Paenibacillus lautus]|uniref:hypothetical protein n=1 Tax=Paenibacillus lautus TaxID=1401 RepID=UPI003D2C644E